VAGCRGDEGWGGWQGGMHTQPPSTAHLTTPVSPGRAWLGAPSLSREGCRCCGSMTSWCVPSPRITVAWCKRVECPIEKIFPKTLRDKFPWAMSVPETWKFTPTSEAALNDADVDDGVAGEGAGDDEE
jgi:hypothetical protein